MISLFAETFELTTTSVQTSTDTGAVSMLILPLFLLAVIVIIAQWKVFKKAGKPGWASIIPVYNTWVLFEITGYPSWMALLLLVPIANLIAVVYGIMASYKLAKLFGKSDLFAFCNVLFPVVTYPVLGFGKAAFSGAAPASAMPVMSPSSSVSAQPDAPMATMPVSETPVFQASQQPIAQAAPAAEAPAPAETPTPAPYAPAPESPAPAPVEPQSSSEQPPFTPPTNPVA